MLSYRHGFHAGNHADVLKHYVQTSLLTYLNQKDAPYTYIDTHSGAGVYALDSGYATKTGEFQTGIARVWNRTDAPPEIQAYLDQIKFLNPNGKLKFYPGSPFLANQLCRDQDKLRLFEIHSNEIKILCDNFRALEDAAHEKGERKTIRGKRWIISDQDGFAQLKSLLPTPSRRALVLIDPPYEVKEDYRRVKQTLEDALKRFPGGTYAIWYPVLQRNESRQLPNHLKKLPCKSWLNVSLAIHEAQPDGIALHHSGMFIINPPWTLEAELRRTLPWLAAALAQGRGAGYEIEAGENPG